MMAILLATLSEAQPLVDLLHAEKRLDQPFVTYSFAPTTNHPGGLVIITGIGPEDAAAATDYAITHRGASHILNVGICGALTQAVEPGHMCHITEIVEGDSLLEDPSTPTQSLTTESLWRALPPARLVSVSEPVFGGEGRTILANHADMVDMEGFAIVQVCRQKGIAFQLLKVVSDRADDTGHEELHLNLTRVSTILAEEVVAGLEHHLTPPNQSLLARLFNFVKIEHTLFSLPLLLAGAWLGAGRHWPGLRLLFLIMLAGVGARALGMAMNRILDRRLDQLNPRTANRELPSGKLSLTQAWTVAALGLTVYLAACTALGPLCLWLSPIPALVLINYSLLKRLSSLCHYGIGLCLALGPLGAYVAVRGTTAIDEAILMLAIFTFCWISGFDIIYALQDIKADRELGVHSLPATLGSTGAQGVAAFTHLVAAAAAIKLWILLGSGLTSGLALIITLTALGLAYYSKLPLPVRFFPVSAIAGIAGALIAML